MLEYKLKFLLDGRPTRTSTVTAADDTDAIFIGRQRATGSEVEIWCGTRQVALIAPLSAARDAPSNVD